MRERMLATRDAMSDADRASQSRAVTSRLAQLDALEQARTVAAYVSFRTELDTEQFLATVLHRSKRLLLPRIEPGKRLLRFYHVTRLEGSLLAGPWGIREPDPACCAQAEMREIDLMLVPGVAFTRECDRLGYGGGFYDTVIGAMRDGVPTVAAAFTGQIVDSLPLQAHDRRIDMVLTEDAVYRAGPRPAQGPAVSTDRE